MVAVTPATASSGIAGCQRIAVVVGEDGRAPDRSWIPPLRGRSVDVTILRPVEPECASAPLLSPLLSLGFGDSIGIYSMLRTASEGRDAVADLNLERLSDTLTENCVRHRVVHVPTRASVVGRRGRRHAAMAVLVAARGAGATAIVLTNTPVYADELARLVDADPAIRLVALVGSTDPGAEFAAVEDLWVDLGGSD